MHWLDVFTYFSLAQIDFIGINILGWWDVLSYFSLAKTYALRNKFFGGWGVFFIPPLHIDVCVKYITQPHRCLVTSCENIKLQAPIFCYNSIYSSCLQNVPFLLGRVGCFYLFPPYIDRCLRINFMGVIYRNKFFLWLGCFYLFLPCLDMCLSLLRHVSLRRWGVFTYSSLAQLCVLGIIFWLGGVFLLIPPLLIVCVLEQSSFFTYSSPYLEALDRCIQKHSKTRLQQTRL